MNEKISVLLSLLYIVNAKSHFTPLQIDHHPCKAEKLKHADRYVCDSEGNVMCLAGWTKADREDPLNPCGEPICDSCVNGVCRAPNHCACEVGWEGEDCNTCVTLPGCLHGHCDNEALSCTCEDGYEGGLCDRPICEGGDAGACVHGTCMAPGKCSCDSGWEDDDCNTCVTLPGCQHGSCLNGSLGIANSCFCEEGWTGHMCDTPKCSPACVNGQCLNWRGSGPVCVCELGWSGANCSVCSVYPGCENGTCTSPGQCLCDSPDLDVHCGIHNISLTLP